ncbi:hypothetical protein P3X46_007599 [Hevea brasiliensis]|uniref:RNase H type-1 domain-containing protein n=1 Tax=Hevea brasiliensis TaxID=3981 RepID=A0ABQ9MY55_HEVBR|nr:uncharacterized protein LOC131179499 [Hevea brasiliensis]KAJ9183789.1 hypothetical protein P3X46_007599 [Hevea brasiliensis]
MSGLCPVCNHEPETILHCLITCPFARDCWVTSDVGWWGVVDNFPASLSMIQTQCDRQQVQKAIMIAWEIWNARNGIVWKQKHVVPYTVLQKVHHFLQEWQLARVSMASYDLNTVPAVIKWQPPDAGLKCNVDACFDAATGLAGVGLVIRDSNGQFVEGMCKSLGYDQNSLNAEAMRVREALSWVKGRLFNMPLVMEMDCLMVKQALNCILHDNSYFATLIHDCKFLVRDVASLSFSFVKKSANQVAHVLVRATDSMSGLAKWSVSPPAFIHDVPPFGLNNN